MFTLFIHNQSSEFIEKICEKYGRYRCDQLQILQNTALENPDWIEVVVNKCVKDKLYSVNDFRDVVYYLQQDTIIVVSYVEASGSKIKSPPVHTRDLNEYVSRMGGNLNG